MTKKENPDCAAKATPNNSPQGYYYFQCSQGHENKISLIDEHKYQVCANGEIIVSCQACSWKSSPFKPAFLQQQMTPGDILFWVYTTSDPETLRSSFNISFGSDQNHKDHAKPTAAEEPQREKTRALPAMPRTKKSSHERVEELSRHLQTPEDKNAATPVRSPKTKRLPRNNIDEIFREIKQEQRTIEDTVEMQAKPSQPQPEPQQDSALSSPISKPSPSSWLVEFGKTALWILALAGVIAVYFKIDKQHQENFIAAIRALEVKTVMPASKPTPLPAVSPAVSKESQALLVALQSELVKQRDTHQKLQQNHKALTVSYQNLRKSSQKLQHNFKKLRSKYAQTIAMQNNYRQLQESRQKLLAALSEEFIVENLYKGEKDFIQTSFARNGKYFVYYQNANLGRRKVRKTLKIGILNRQRIESHQLFQTVPIREKKSEIPFVYTWDGKSQVALLTRIAGENSIYHIRFQVVADKVHIVDTRKLHSVFYPQVLGAPTISPDGEKIAWLHKDANGIQVEVYYTRDARLQSKISGGGDTSKVPTWSPDSTTLFFPSNTHKGIISWQFLSRTKQIKNLPQEIYGRYISCSPDNRYLAFFLRSIRGKAHVDLCVWEHSNAQAQIETWQSNILTIEVCKPSWNANSRFLAVIHSGQEDCLTIQDATTKLIFTVFRQKGRLTWLDWTCPQFLAFTYKEGLFNRPYRVKFHSLFIQNSRK